MQALHPFLTLGISLLLGIVSAYIANRKGKNPYFWFFIGFLFGLIGIIFLLFRKAEKAPVLEEIVEEPVIETPKCVGHDKFWYFLDKDRKQCGPVSFESLKKEFTEGSLNTSSYVWNEEMENWKQIKDIANF